MKPFLVYVGPTGRLGNQLRLLSHLVAWSHEHGVAIGLPALGRYADHFAAFRRDAFCRYPPVKGAVRPGRVTARAAPLIGRLLGRVGILPEFRIDEDFFAPGNQRVPAGPSLLIGWPRTWQRASLIAKHRAAVIEAFVLADPYRERVAAFVQRLRAGVDVVVGVHIRRGDYRTYRDGCWFYSDTDYAHSLRGIVAQLAGRRTRSVVASDEPVTTAAFDGLDIVVAPSDPVQALYSLAAVDWLIGPPSTFSAWSSFIGDVPLRFLERAGEVPPLSRFSVFPGYG